MLKTVFPRIVLCIGLVLGLLTSREAIAQGLAFQSLQDFPWSLNPSSDLVKAPDGYFYGLTIEGGDRKGGTIYRIAPGTALQLVHHFDWMEWAPQPNDGGTHPEAAFTLANDGCLYGATRNGGAYGAGVIFKYDPAGAGFSVVHHFGPGDGTNCLSLFQDSVGNLIGVNRAGGPLGGGVIFRFTLQGEYAVIHAFEPDRSSSRFDLPERKAPCEPTYIFQASDGFLYGVTAVGGPTRQDPFFPGATYGTVFRVEPAGGITLLHEFTANQGHSSATLVEGSDGSLYGMTGGASFLHEGTFYRLTKDGQHTVLHSIPLDGSEGWLATRLFRGTDGYFYTSCFYGGAFDGGVIQRFSTSGNLEIIHQFPREYRAVGRSGVMEADGFLYGVLNRVDLVDAEPARAEVSRTPARHPVAAPKRRNSGAYRLKVEPTASDNSLPVVRSEVRVVSRKVKQLRVPVLANDRDPDRDTLTIESATGTDEVTATVDATGKRLLLAMPASLTRTQSVPYTVADGNGGTSQGSVLLRPKMAGSYRGTLNVGDLAGTAKFAVTSTGAFTGEFQVGGLKYRAKGRFDSNDRFTGAARTRTGEVLELSLTLGIGTTNTITGYAGAPSQEFVVSMTAKR